MTAVEVVTIRPKQGALPRLKELRRTMLAEYHARHPEVTTQWYEQEDGSIVDIWIWPDRASGEAALGDPTTSPTFTNEWQPLVEVISFHWATPVGA
ncbi:hypothetical protein AB0F17_53905 [Nonomuraea sp. NPDC026600]|uniref:hypothetical protein n=1 Tax=Nonomuraea sp. NPDC026600 TaxID=3155363 RepID=UPI0033C6A538